MGLIRIPVENLRVGMYVAELDRAWTDTPFMFQGFTVDGPETLAELRRLCRHVYVDQTLTATTVSEQLVGDTVTATPVQTRQRRLRRHVRDGLTRRDAAHDYLGRVMTDIRLGRSVDAEEAREQVTGLVSLVTRDASAALWLTQLKSRDEYTSLHCLNVCVLSIAFCRELGYGQEDLKTIGLGALLHDIGKARTPLEILNKPGKLSRDEFAIMQRHPEDGYRMMRAGGKVPAEALDIIRHHHERISGHGYPQGRLGGELAQPVLAVAIADVYDAMTSDRVYRPGMASDLALRLMYREAEQTFGVELMEAFIRCVGIYPVGSLVELRNGAVALVVSVEPDRRLMPDVLLLRDAEGQDLAEPERVDLADRTDGMPDSPWHIRGVVRAEQAGVDNRALLRQEIARLGIAV